MVKTINKLTQLKIGQIEARCMHVYHFCIGYGGHLEYGNKKASADVERSQFGFTTVKNI